MESSNSVITDLNGVQHQIPLGYRFSPSDEELVVDFLRKKVNSLPLPTNVIPQITDVFRFSPWDLPGTLDKKRHFFSTRTRNNSCIINTGCGYWKHVVDEDEQVIAPGTNSVVGIKKSWIFYTEKSIETQWIMHQFCLVRAFDASLTKKKVVEVGKLIVCRIYERDEEEMNANESGDQFEEDMFSFSSSSGSSDGSSNSSSSSSGNCDHGSSGDLDQEANSHETAS